MAKFAKSQLLALTRDAEFQGWIDNDPELDRLWNKPRKTRDERLADLGLALGGVVEVGSVNIPAPTAGALLILGTIDSPFLSREPRRLIDVDMAVYVLCQGRRALDGVAAVAELEAKAAGVCDDAELDRADAADAIDDLLRACFAACELLPDTGGEPERCRYDLAWYVGITGSASRAANLPADQIGWNMPLTLVGYYCLQDYRQQGGKLVRPTDNEAIMARMETMMREQIAKKGYE